MKMLSAMILLCVVLFAFTSCTKEGADTPAKDNGDNAAANNDAEIPVADETPGAPAANPEPISFLNKAETGERNNYNGSVGYEIYCLADIQVSAVGRPLNGEMNGNHMIYIWDAGSETLVASAEVTPASPLDGLGFKTAQLKEPVILKKGESYRIVSAEYKDGDKWYDVGVAETDDIPDLQPNGECEIITPAFTGDGQHDLYPENQWNPGGLRGYVGVTFYYVPVS